MPWIEFRALLEGLGPETPLGRMVSIRSETDPDTIGRFTKEQMKIYSDWRNRRAAMVSDDSMEAVLETLKNAFIDLAR